MNTITSNPLLPATATGPSPSPPTSQSTSPSVRLLSGKVCQIWTDQHSIGIALTEGLADQGARVTLACPASGDSEDDGKPSQSDWSTRQAAARLFERIEQQNGPTDMLVFCFMPNAALEARDLCSLDDAGWHDRCRAAQRHALYAMQAALPRLAPRAGTIVGLGPSLAINGATGLVPLTTALEGQRALLKSAARQWAGRGIRAHWVMAHPHVLAPALRDARLAFRPDRTAMALDPLPQLRSDIAPAIAFLGSPAGRAITGETLFIDGGEWMLP